MLPVPEFLREVTCYVKYQRLRLPECVLRTPEKHNDLRPNPPKVRGDIPF